MPSVIYCDYIFLVLVVSVINNCSFVWKCRTRTHPVGNQKSQLFLFKVRLKNHKLNPLIKCMITRFRLNAISIHLAAVGSKCIVGENRFISSTSAEGIRRGIQTMSFGKLTKSKFYNEKRILNLKHLFDGSDLNVYNTEIVNLSAGAPGLDLLENCPEIFLKATEHRMKFERENNSFLFQYGPAVGGFEHRENIAKFLSKGYQAKVDRNDLVLTSGATHGLHLILSTLLDLSAFVFVDEVTYMIALECFAQFPTMKIRTVLLKSDGVDVDYLENQLKDTKFESTSKLFWGVYYTIPTHHNPTGIIFSPKTNERLIQIARQYEILVICDDVYNLLNYREGAEPPKRLFAYDNMNDEDYKGNVISNGSFSKILSPGIRLGWMECSPRCLEAFYMSGVLKSGGAANHYTAGIISSLIQLGLAESQLDMYSRKYGERMKAVCALLSEKLSKKCEFKIPDGGYFIWIKFPIEINCIDFNNFCKNNYGIFAITGDRFSANSTHKNFMRITIAFHDVQVLKEAITKLCVAFDEYQTITQNC